MTSSRVSVVIATRDRWGELTHTVRRLRELPENPEIIVVDNASSDESVRAVCEEFPDVRLIALSHNRGTAARNVGVEEARTPYVAFCDDDSWWEPGALQRAADLLDEYPRIGLIAARPLVGDERRPDPIVQHLEKSPLPAGEPLPGPAVLGFLGYASIVRREAFMQVGGFSRLLSFGCEERLLAYDLAAAGWSMSYVSDVTAVHLPSPIRDSPEHRRSLEQRNDVLTAWLRRPVPLALWRTLRLTAWTPLSATARTAWLAAIVRIPAALWHRRRLPEPVERYARLLEAV